MKNNILPMFEEEIHGDKAIRYKITLKDQKNINVIWEFLILGILQGVFNDDCYTGIEMKKNYQGKFCAIWVTGDEQAKKKADAENISSRSR